MALSATGPITTCPSSTITRSRWPARRCAARAPYWMAGLTPQQRKALKGMIKAELEARRN